MVITNFHKNKNVKERVVLIGFTILSKIRFGVLRCFIISLEFYDLSIFNF